jgi:uncharacterized membrane protein (UPF0136 family)
MQVHHDDHTTVAGTVTGTVITVAANIDSQDYLRTVILACVGAIASFVISIVLKWIWSRFAEKK